MGVKTGIQPGEGNLTISNDVARLLDARDNGGGRAGTLYRENLTVRLQGGVATIESDEFVLLRFEGLCHASGLVWEQGLRAASE